MGRAGRGQRFPNFEGFVAPLPPLAYVVDQKRVWSTTEAPPSPPLPKLINCLPPTIIRGKLDEQRTCCLDTCCLYTCCLYTRCLYKAELALSRVCWTRLYLLPYGQAGRSARKGHRGDTNCSVFLIGIQRTPFHQCQAFT